MLTNIEMVNSLYTQIAFLREEFQDKRSGTFPPGGRNIKRFLFITIYCSLPPLNLL